MRHILILAAGFALAAVQGLAGDDRPRQLFEAGIALGESADGRLIIRQLAAAGEVPDEFLAGLAAGIVGRERLRFLLTGSGTAPSAATPALAPQGQSMETCGVISPSAGASPADAGVAQAAMMLPGGLPNFGNESFWIRLGDGQAPGLYMLADPACPYSARALETLAPDISAGRLHVRLALAPVLSPLSRDLAALIMLDPDPAQAAWSMLLGAARGAGLPAAQGLADQLGELGDTLIEANLDWMRQRGLSAVPHFVWSADGQWSERTGVQDPGIFAGADALANSRLTMHGPEAVQAMVEAAAMGEAQEMPALPN